MSETTTLNPTVLSDASGTLDQEPGDNTPNTRRTDALPAAAAHGIGLIGLHAPGRATALALLRAGHVLLACDPDPVCCRAYADEAGPDADVTDQPTEVGRRCDIVLLHLPLGADATTIHTALQHTLAPGSLIIDLGPALATEIRHLAAELAPASLHLMDVAVLADGSVLAGGTPPDLARTHAILRALGDLLPTGGPGTAKALAALVVELDPMPDRAAIQALIAASA